MKSIFLTIARYVSEVAASEAGELLSVRRKWHLLEAERYARLEHEGAKTEREVATSAPATTADRRRAPRSALTSRATLRHA